MAAVPKLVVFDLDYTLWPFWVDTHVAPPFHTNRYGQVEDRRGTHVECYDEAWPILNHLAEQNINIAVASRTSETLAANQLIHLFNWEKFFCNKQIYPGCKITHFKRFQAEMLIPFEEMLFFDDEERNIVDVSKLGVTCILSEDGISWEVFKHGMKKFAENINK